MLGNSVFVFFFFCMLNISKLTFSKIFQPESSSSSAFRLTCRCRSIILISGLPLGSWLATGIADLTLHLHTSLSQGSFHTRRSLCLPGHLWPLWPTLSFYLQVANRLNCSWIIQRVQTNKAFFSQDNIEVIDLKSS